MFCRKRAFIAIIMVLALLLSACGGKGEPAPSGSAHEGASASETGKAASPKPSAAAESTKGGPASAEPETSGSASAEASPNPTPSPSPTPVPTPTADPKSVAVDNWIAGIPDYVPKFGHGKLDENVCKVVEGPVSSVFALRFSAVAKADVDAYAEVLKTEGYVVAVEAIDNSYTLTASLNRGREIATLVITFSETAGIAIFTLGAAV